MAAGVQHALDLSCRWMVSETGVAVPGEPNSSMNNMLRAGFKEVGLTRNFVPEGVGWMPAAPRQPRERGPHFPHGAKAAVAGGSGSGASLAR